MTNKIGFALGAALVALAAPAAQAANTTYPGTVAPIVLTVAEYAQSFDSLASTGTTGTAVPDGWQLFEGGNNGNASYAIGNGSSNGGNIYSFGLAGSTDRALGGLTSGNLTPIRFGAIFQNDLGGVIDSLSVGFTGEQWRNGGGRSTLSFEYLVGATDIGGDNWESVGALNFLSPDATTTEGLRDGNAAAYSLELSSLIAGLEIAEGETFGLRWSLADGIGADDGLAIDNLELAASVAAVPEPTSWALMISGFGLVGVALRRRPRAGYRPMAV